MSENENAAGVSLGPSAGLSDAQIANSRHGPPIAAEIMRMQVLIDELRDEVRDWRAERNDIAAQLREAQDK